MTKAHPRKPPPANGTPMSPFASPLHGRGHGPNPDAKAAYQAFMKEYGNNTDEHVQVLNPNPVWALENVLGAPAVDAITKSGHLAFHCVGDTGFDSFPISQNTGQIRWSTPNKQFETALGLLVGMMCRDVDPDHMDRGPAFLLHLGDVNYFDNTRTGYAQQFYEPFSNYIRKIIAITGNHDVEVKLSQQNFACEAFIENFCNGPWIPPAAAGVHPPREMVKQPGLYWRLDAPFVQIIGLCTNVGENGGVLRSDAAGTDQYEWFCETLKEVQADQAKAEAEKAPRPALIVALHHPPYTTGNHQPSPQMSSDLDAAFNGADVWPDLILAAHDHDYQRFTRTVQLADKTTADIPYIVAGGGARFHAQPPSSNQGPAPAIPGVMQNSFGAGNGYLIVTAQPYSLTVQYKAIDHADNNQSESIQVDLRARRVQMSA